MIEAYPLYWPELRPRTPLHKREVARFDMSFARARDEVIRQVELLTGKYTHMKERAALIISTNVELRQDGLPMANRRQPDDTGVAVYFNYKGTQVCFACDRWKKIEDNMQAIAKTIDALRGIDRWGTGDMIQAAFKGFAALPPPVGKRNWRVVLGMPERCTMTLAMAKEAYRRAAMNAHEDREGGSHEAMIEVNKAWEEAQRELG